MLSADGTPRDITITINGTNDDPVVSGPVLATQSEDNTVFTLDLLSGASDVDGDALSIDVNNVNHQAGDDSGVTINNNGTLTIDPDAYTSLASGDSETVTYSYTIEDGIGGSVNQTASFTITGTNDAPVITGEFTGSVTEDAFVVDGDLVASGELSITDVDAGEAGFQAGSVSGDYGTLTIDAAGAWTYTVDNDLSAIQGLGSGDTLPDTVTVLSTDGTSRDITITINGTDDILSGNAIDGYIEGATIFADANGDGVLDAGEVFATTGDDGAFSLTNAEGRLVLQGGGTAIDAATGLTFNGTLEAPAGSTVITPLTTLISKLEQNQGMGAIEAQALVKTVFGISSSEDLMTFDPVAATLSGGASVGDGVEIATAGVILQSLATQAGAALRGAADADAGADDTISWDLATSSVFDAITTKITTLSGNEELPLTDTVFEELVTGAANAANLTVNAKADLATSVDEVADVMLSGAVSLNAIDGTDPIAALTEMAKTAVVLQHQSTADIETAIEAADTTAISNLLTSYSGAALEDAIDDATIGDVTGTLINDAPVAVDDAISTIEDTSVTVLASTLIANDRDSDDDEITLVGVGNSINGSVGIINGNVVFTPDLDFFGNAFFEYTVIDANGSASTGTATVSVSVSGTEDNYVVAVDDGNEVDSVDNVDDV